MSRRGYKIVAAALFVTACLLIALLLGPRVPVDTTVTFDPSAIGDDPDTYLDKREGTVGGIRHGLQKEIVWADPIAKTKTPLAIVYVHGFSASKGEVRPLPDKVASALGANLFFTRLTGHGQDGAAMASGSVNAWVNDCAEALAIGRMIGNRVVVMATSTGAALATWATTQPSLSNGVAAMVFMSPNFGVQNAGAGLLTMPWGKQIAELVAGRERGFTPLNALHEKFWTTRYPTAATLPMAAIAEFAREAPVGQVRIPALFILSDQDKVVRPELTREIAARWGAPHQLIAIEKAGDPMHHVLAGDALSPSTTGMVAERIVGWLKTLAG
jgi:pimeloyl-ACP methyl ester carboxylesterase